MFLVDWAVKIRIRPPEFETSICDVKYHVSLSGIVIPEPQWLWPTASCIPEPLRVTQVLDSRFPHGYSAQCVEHEKRILGSATS
ncbi:protein TIC 20-IV, chloroplastic-like [Dorcoceras hygrometricum]|uniref:Protein TIC 20-IV, chloroplastic-like n=1 Tax=Dorcoceras hygrometricum TaxID=472368 RepID=A0A2Z7BVI7_9LAMI|nr:protein TIC 20-IV, chloroplastic-like [Dorcoceras hygrometricum]